MEGKESKEVRELALTRRNERGWEDEGGGRRGDERKELRRRSRRCGKKEAEVV